MDLSSNIGGFLGTFRTQGSTTENPVHAVVVAKSKKIIEATGKRMDIWCGYVLSGGVIVAGVWDDKGRYLGNYREFDLVSRICEKG